MNSRTQSLRFGIACLLTLIANRRTQAGDLNPPPGPVGPTMKTLAEVEPRIAVNATNAPGDAASVFKIAQPGSYYLTGNISGESGKNGIEITTDRVTLDLAGFELRGGTGTLDGIKVSVGADDVAVFNGSVNYWQGDGVDLGATYAYRVADLRVIANAAAGISSAGGTTGRGAVTQCLAAGNVGTGIAAFGAAVSSCVARSNGGMGIQDAAAVTDCVAINNASVGILALSGAAVNNCQASGSGSHGIVTGAGGAIMNCSATSNNGSGILAGLGSTITQCTARSNFFDGINPGEGSTVTACSASLNSGDGILVGSDCRVAGNACDGNGADGSGAGIHVTGSDNRIEGNNATDNNRGFDIDGAGNFIARNVTSGNSVNWDVAANNVILVVSAANAGAVFGNSGGIAPGSTDPNANFAY